MSCLACEISCSSEYLEYRLAEILRNPENVRLLTAKNTEYSEVPVVPFARITGYEYSRVPVVSPVESAESSTLWTGCGQLLQQKKNWTA